MDSNYMTQLMLSIAIFAPGLVLLAGLAFVGLMMLVERTVLRGKLPASAPAATTASASLPNPEPGPVVEGLKDSLGASVPQTAVEPERKQANG